jgi:hypothetical protein
VNKKVKVEKVTNMGLIDEIKGISKYESGLRELHEEECDDDRNLSSEDYVIVVDDEDIEKLRHGSILYFGGMHQHYLIHKRETKL